VSTAFSPDSFAHRGNRHFNKCKSGRLGMSSAHLRVMQRRQFNIPPSLNKRGGVGYHLPTAAGLPGGSESGLHGYLDFGGAGDTTDRTLSAQLICRCLSALRCPQAAEGKADPLGDSRHNTVKMPPIGASKHKTWGNTYG
jgi:hypothetical protein